MRKNSTYVTILVCSNLYQLTLVAFHDEKININKRKKEMNQGQSLPLLPLLAGCKRRGD